MRFKVIETTPIDSKFGTFYEYTLKSLDGKYTKKTNDTSIFKGEPREVGTIVNTYYEHWSSRLHRRLNRIGINATLGCNYPWIYLDKVNDISVAGVVNSEHGWCIGYHTQLYPSFTKDLFKKIKEIINNE